MRRKIRKKNKSKLPSQLEDAVFFGDGNMPTYELQEEPKVDITNLIDQYYDRKPGIKAKVLPPELKNEILKNAAKKQEVLEKIFRYYTALLKEGMEPEEALRKTYENIYPF